MQYKVTKITRYETDKAGQPYKYNKVRTVLGFEGVEGLASYLDGGKLKGLKIGDTVLGEVVVEGKWTNFVPASEAGKGQPAPGVNLAEVNQKLDMILSLLNSIDLPLKAQAAQKRAMQDIAPIPHDIIEDVPF